MSDRKVVLDVAGNQKLARDLAAGGVFVPGVDINLNEDLELVLRGTGDDVRLSARVVFNNGTGIGLQIHNFDAAMKDRIAALAEATPAAETTELTSNEIAAAAAAAAAAAENDVDTEQAEGEADDPKKAANLHERLRGLPLAQQVKLAHHGELNERILLERIYGKTVWEGLLRNPRITGPEVARIARMGSLPRPLMEIILNNGGWLQIPEVRRALLTNARLGTDQVMRIMRMLPKHEIKLATTQTIYPMAVREVAKKLMKEMGGG